MGAYYKMETIEHFAQISLVARLLGGERVLSREEVRRLQGLRDTYGIASPAPICEPGDARAQGGAGGLPGGAGAGRAGRAAGRPPAIRRRAPRAGGDAEIRLTYRELAALIADGRA